MNTSSTTNTVWMWIDEVRTTVGYGVAMTFPEQQIFTARFPGSYSVAVPLLRPAVTPRR